MSEGITNKEVEKMMEAYARHVERWMGGVTIIDSMDRLNPYSPHEVNGQLIRQRDELNREIAHYRSLIE